MSKPDGDLGKEMGMIKDMIKAVALYLRVSSTKQKKEGSSLKTQEERLREYCEREKWQVHDVYWDDETGASRDRQDFQRLLRDAMDGKFQAVLVYDLDRLARDNIYFLTLYKETLPKMGVEVLSYCQPGDPTTPEGQFMYDIHATLAEYERHKIRERCLRGRIQKVKEHKFTGGALPYAVGWDKEKKVFVPVDQEAEIYRQIFDLFINRHMSISAIARELGAKGYLTRKGGVGRNGERRGEVPFSDRYIRFLIESPTACGEWYRCRVVSRKLKTPIRKPNRNNLVHWEKTYREKQDWLMIKVPAVIPKERWERAREILRTRARPPRDMDAATLLQGFLFCAHCGSRLGAKWLGGKRPGAEARYRCVTQIYRVDRRYKRFQGKNCDLPSFRQSDLDSAVWSNVEELITNPAMLWEAACGDREDDEGGIEARLAELRKNLAAAKAAEQRAAQLFRMGVDPGIAERQVAEAVSRRKAVERELSDAEKMAANAKAQEALKETAFETLTSLKDRIQGLSLIEKREILGILIPGGPDYRIEIDITGQVTVRGAIDFEKVASTSTPYSAARYET